MVPLENPHEVAVQEIVEDIPVTTSRIDSDQNEAVVPENNNVDDDRRAVYRGRWFYQK